jgi:hypothetical protein
MITEDKIATLKVENPGFELHLLTNDDTEAQVVVKTPSEGEWRRFRSMSSDDAQRAMALRALVLGCVVYPTMPEFAAMLDRRPGLAETFGSKLVDIAGVSMATTVRKL